MNWRPEGLGYHGKQVKWINYFLTEGKKQALTSSANTILLKPTPFTLHLKTH